MDERIYAPEFTARFWAKVQIGGPTDCWPWSGARTIPPVGATEGYGYIWIVGNKTSARAHRIAFAYAYGDFDERLLVCHRCDNPPCCNATHLFLGTRGDNTRDRGRKGRGRRQWGETNSFAKLSAHDVAEIRRLVAGGATQTAVAPLFGIKQPQVSRIVRGTSRQRD